MQEVPEAGKKEKKVRPHWGSYPGRPSWRDLELPRHSSRENPFSKQGHGIVWAGRHIKTPRASAV